jgi:hypothetical protein
MKLLYPKIIRAYTPLNKLLFVRGIRVFVFHKIIPPILHVSFSSGHALDFNLPLLCLDINLTSILLSRVSKKDF